MVSPNQKWSLQPVPPFLEWELYSKELSVSHLIVPFRWRKTMGKEGTGMQLAIGLPPSVGTRPLPPRSQRQRTGTGHRQRASLKAGQG